MSGYQPNRHNICPTSESASVPAPTTRSVKTSRSELRSTAAFDFLKASVS